MTISFGVHAGPQDVPMDALVEFWRLVEAWGADSISVGDHLCPPPPLPYSGPQYEAVALLAALALETSRVRIGCLMFAAPFRNPGILTKSLTTIDHLSGGRVEVGLGAGWHRTEFEAFGYQFRSAPERLDILEETIQIVRSLLDGGPTSFEGRHFRIQNAVCEPRPLQARMPIWIGGRGEKRSLRIAARHADGWNANSVTAMEFRRLNGVLDDWCATEGREPGTLTRSVNLAFELGPPQRAKSRNVDEARPGVMTGHPGDAATMVSDYIEAGAQRVNVLVRSPWDADALEEYLREVVPTLRERFG